MVGGWAGWGGGQGGMGGRGLGVPRANRPHWAGCTACLSAAHLTPPATRRRQQEGASGEATAAADERGCGRLSSELASLLLNRSAARRRQQFQIWQVGDHQHAPWEAADGPQRYVDCAPRSSRTDLRGPSAATNGRLPLRLRRAPQEIIVNKPTGYDKHGAALRLSVLLPPHVPPKGPHSALRPRPSLKGRRRAREPR